jgi:2-hydroxy-6-oxonona-2,4-dienedioate hydrolase
MRDPQKSVTDELVDVRHTIYAQPGRRKTIGAISALIMGGLLDDGWTEKWSKAEHMAAIKCPTLVLWSRYNPGLTPERAALGAKHIPNAQFIVFEQSAHWPQWEEAELFNKVHLDFLRA